MKINVDNDILINIIKNEVLINIDIEQLRALSKKIEIVKTNGHGFVKLVIKNGVIVFIDTNLSEDVRNK